MLVGVQARPELTWARLLREIQELGYRGGRAALKDYLQQVRPKRAPAFEPRSETPSGLQAPVCAAP